MLPGTPELHALNHEFWLDPELTNAQRLDAGLDAIDQRLSLLTLAYTCVPLSSASLLDLKPSSSKLHHSAAMRAR